MTCMCGDAQCPSCGKAQGTYEESISAIVNELVSDWMIVLVLSIIYLASDPFQVFFESCESL